MNEDARLSQKELHEERLVALKAEKKRGRIGDLTPTKSYDDPLVAVMRFP